MAFWNRKSEPAAPAKGVPLATDFEEERMESDSASPASESAVSSARAVRQPAMPNFDPENTFSIQSGHPKPGVLVIAAGDIRRGNASFDSDVRIDGQFLGDLDCIATLTVTGSVHGNIQARRIMLQNDSAVLGSIVCNSSISIASGAQIVGNITANSISCGATVRGNLTATESIRLGAAAVIVGDVTAPEVEILPGATIAGTIRAGNASLFGKDSPYHQRQTD